MIHCPSNPGRSGSRLWMKLNGFLLLGILGTLGAGYLFLRASQIINAHRWTPVHVPLSVTAGQHLSASFTSDLGGDYEIQVDLRKNLPDAELDSIAPPRLLCSVDSSGQAVPLKDHRQPHFTGQNAWANWSYWSGDHFGAVVGWFRAVPGRQYTVVIEVKQAARKLQQLDPHLDVAVSPMGFQEVVFGYALTQLVGSVLLLIALALLVVGTYRQMGERRRAAQRTLAPRIA